MDSARGATRSAAAYSTWNLWGVKRGLCPPRELQIAWHPPCHMVVSKTARAPTRSSQRLSGAELEPRGLGVHTTSRSTTRSSPWATRARRRCCQCCGSFWAGRADWAWAGTRSHSSAVVWHALAMWAVGLLGPRVQEGIGARAVKDVLDEAEKTYLMLRDDRYTCPSRAWASSSIPPLPSAHLVAFSYGVAPTSDGVRPTSGKCRTGDARGHDAATRPHENVE